MREKPRRTNMQRPIKFRAWDTQLGRWADLPNLYSRAKVNLKDSGGEDKEVLDLTTFTKRLIFVQFTGLHDKNGKEIYEGDIVRTTDPFDFDYEYKNDKVFPGEPLVGKVWYYEAMGKFIISDTKKVEIGNVKKFDLNFNADHGGQSLKVIGNIYENPELLDGNKD